MSDVEIQPDLSAVQKQFAFMGWQLAVVGSFLCAVSAAATLAAACVIPMVSKLPADAWQRQIVPVSLVDTELLVALLTAAAVSASIAALLRKAAGSLHTAFFSERKPA